MTFAADSGLQGRPNIIFILADDLGYGDLGCYGQDKSQTPNIDKMAAEGMKFTNHYSGSAVCAPSRCVLMTGRHTGYATIRENGQHPLADDDVTIAELLKQVGYTTGAVGKWGLGEAGSRSTPNKVGFDYWYGFLNQGVAHFYYTPWIWENEEKIVIKENADGKRGVYTHDLLTGKALSFIEANKENPFFLYLSYAIPHAEMAVPEDSLRQYAGKFPEKPKKTGGGGGGYGTGLEGYCGNETPNACYAAMISRMDRDLGTILERLKKLDIDRNTLVVLTSDNGPSGEGGNSIKFFNSSGPLRGQKASLYEGGIRVPMIARWPGMIEREGTSDLISAFWDYMPTFAELAGFERPDYCDGVSLVPTLIGRPEKQEQRQYLYWELSRKQAQAVRMGDWKALRFGKKGDIELYNIKDDIGETANIASENPAVVGQIAKIMHKARKPSDLFPLRDYPEKKKLK